jgi:hypothetical protein
VGFSFSDYTIQKNSMDTSLNQLADMITNDVKAGLKSVSNVSFSQEQLKDRIVLTANRMIPELKRKHELDIESISQSITSLKFKKEFINLSPASEFQKKQGQKVLTAKIPKLLFFDGFKPVVYFGETEFHSPFKVIYGSRFAYSKYDLYSKKKPTVWIKEDICRIVNPPADNTSKFTLQGVFENFRALYEFKECAINDDSPFPVPAYLKDMIVGKIVNDYMRHYAMSGAFPNNQTDPPTISGKNA